MRGRRTHGFHAVGHKPVETLDEQEETKHEEEGHVELIAKDGEGEERFGYEHPCLIVEALGGKHLNGKKRERLGGNTPPPRGAEEIQRRVSGGPDRRGGHR